MPSIPKISFNFFHRQNCKKPSALKPSVKAKMDDLVGINLSSHLASKALSGLNTTSTTNGNQRNFSPEVESKNSVGANIDQLSSLFFRIRLCH